MTIECSTCHQPIVDGEPANTGEWVGETATYHHANPAHCVAATARRCAEMVEDSDVVRIGGLYNREDDGKGTLSAAADAIRREFLEGA